MRYVAEELFQSGVCSMSLKNECSKLLNGSDFARRFWCQKKCVLKSTKIVLFGIDAKIYLIVPLTLMALAGGCYTPN